MVARGLELQRRKEGKAVKISSSSNYIASQPSDHFTILLDLRKSLVQYIFYGSGQVCVHFLSTTKWQPGE